MTDYLAAPAGASKDACWSVAGAGNIQHRAEVHSTSQAGVITLRLQERRNRLESREYRLEAAIRRSSAWHSRTAAHIAIACSFHSADDLDARLNQLNTIGYTAKLHPIGGWYSATQSNHQYQHHRVTSQHFLLRLDQRNKSENQTLAKTDWRLEQRNQIALSTNVLKML